jgi:hypothetical protein
MAGPLEDLTKGEREEREGGTFYGIVSLSSPGGQI